MAMNRGGGARREGRRREKDKEEEKEGEGRRKEGRKEGKEEGGRKSLNSLLIYLMEVDQCLDPSSMK